MPKSVTDTQTRALPVNQGPIHLLRLPLAHLLAGLLLHLHGELQGLQRVCKGGRKLLSSRLR